MIRYKCTRIGNTHLGKTNSFCLDRWGSLSLGDATGLAPGKPAGLNLIIVGKLYYSPSTIRLTSNTFPLASSRVSDSNQVCAFWLAVLSCGTTCSTFNVLICTFRDLSLACNSFAIVSLLALPSCPTNDCTTARFSEMIASWSIVSRIVPRMRFGRLPVPPRSRMRPLMRFQSNHEKDKNLFTQSFWQLHRKSYELADVIRTSNLNLEDYIAHIVVAQTRFASYYILYHISAIRSTVDSDRRTRVIPTLAIEDTTRNGSSPVVVNVEPTPKYARLLTKRTAVWKSIIAASTGLEIHHCRLHRDHVVEHR